MIIAAGLDGCPRGWVAAILEQKSEVFTTRVLAFEDLPAVRVWFLKDAPQARIGVDVPIGLPQLVGYRACDVQARALLAASGARDRRPSVFKVPDREVASCASFAAVQALIQQRRDQGLTVSALTVQGFGIVGKIVEADTMIRSMAERDWLVEMHPEVSFRLMATRSMLSKDSDEGKAERDRLLVAKFGDFSLSLPKPSYRATSIDIRDAYACLWSAIRLRAGKAITLGENDHDVFGIPMRMVA